MKGFIANVFRNIEFGDCTNGGLTARTSSIILTSNDIELPKIFDIEPRKDVHMEMRMRTAAGSTFPIVVPLDYDDKWYMFGGNFAWCSDSRWPFAWPVKIFVRHEGYDNVSHAKSIKRI